MNEHRRVIMIGAATILAVIGVFLWMVVFDKGELAIQAEPIYDVSIEGSGIKGVRTLTCSSNPCVTPLPAGDYVLTFYKEGHESETARTMITRGDRALATIDFSRIPTAGEITPALKHFEYMSNFFEPIKTEGFALEFDETFQKQRLMKEEEVWAYFDRPLDDVSYFENPTGDQVIVSEKSGSLYAVNHAESSRALLGTLENVRAVEWSPSNVHGVVFTDSSTWWLDLESGSLNEWGWNIEPTALDWLDEETIIFGTTTDVESLNQSGVDPLTHLLAAVQTARNASPQPLIVAEYDRDAEAYGVIYELPKEDAGKTIEVTSNDAGGRLFYRIEGRVFEIAR